MSKFNFKSLNNINCYRKNNVYFLCSKNDYKQWFDFLSKIVLTKFKDCNLIYADEGSISGINFDEIEEIIDQSNIVIFPVTNTFLNENKDGLRSDLELAFLKHKVIIPISDETLDLNLYKSVFGNLQYYKRRKSDKNDKELVDKIVFGLYSRFFEESVQKEKYKIFISYRKNDYKLVKELINSIHHHEEGLVFSFWFDNFLFPGEDYKHEIETAINEADLVIFLGTKKLLDKDNYVFNVEYPYVMNVAKKPAIGILDDEITEKEFKDMFKNVDEIAKLSDINTIFKLLEKHFDFNEIKNDINNRDNLYKYASLYCSNVGTYNDEKLGVEIFEKLYKKGDIGAAGGLATYYKNIITLTNSPEDDQKWMYYANIVFEKYILKLKNEEKLQDEEILMLISASEETFERSPNLVLGKLHDLMIVLNLIYEQLNKSKQLYDFYIDKFIDYMFMMLIHVKYQLDYRALLTCLMMISELFTLTGFNTQKGDYIPQIELVLNYAISIKTYLTAKNNQLDSSLDELIKLLASQINKALDFYKPNEDTYFTILCMSSAIGFAYSKKENYDDAIDIYNKFISAFLKCIYNEKYIYTLQYESYFGFKNYCKMLLLSGYESQLEKFVDDFKNGFLGLYNEQLPSSRNMVYIAKMLNVMHFRTYFKVEDIDVNKILEFEEQIQSFGLPDNAFSHTSNVEFEMMKLDLLDEDENFLSEEDYNENSKAFFANDCDSIVEETIVDTMELRLEHDLLHETRPRFYEFFDVEFRNSFYECLKLFKRIYKTNGSKIYEFDNIISTYASYLEFLAEIGQKDEYIKIREELLEIFETLPQEVLKDLEDDIYYIASPVDDINDDQIAIDLYKAICDLSDSIIKNDLIESKKHAKNVKILVNKANTEDDLESDILLEFARVTLAKYNNLTKID